MDLFRQCLILLNGSYLYTFGCTTSSLRCVNEDCKPGVEAEMTGGGNANSSHSKRALIRDVLPPLLLGSEEDLTFKVGQQSGFDQPENNIV